MASTPSSARSSSPPSGPPRASPASDPHARLLARVSSLHAALTTTALSVSTLVALNRSLDAAESILERASPPSSEAISPAWGKARSNGGYARSPSSHAHSPQSARTKGIVDELDPTMSAFSNGRQILGVNRGGQIRTIGVSLPGADVIERIGHLTSELKLRREESRVRVFAASFPMSFFFFAQR